MSVQEETLQLSALIYYYSTIYQILLIIHHYETIAGANPCFHSALISVMIAQMKQLPSILKIAVPCPLRQCLDYLPPDDIDISSLEPGIRVDVPFGRQHKVGILMGFASYSELPAEKLKKVTAVLDKQPILNEAALKLAQWISQYYHHPVGEVVATCLPKLLRSGSAPPDNNAIKNPGFTAQLPPQLNDQQLVAVDKISSTTNFKTFLLEGVTGSGKTEVYLQAIKKVLDAGKQALVLVPEIGLTPQTVLRFQRRFDVCIATLHSKLTDKERLASWSQAKKGVAKIIIGTRSAILTPFAKLGIIIVDEEHDMSFKQQSGLRYAAREVAIMRAKFEDIPVVLGTATPALETLYNAKRERFDHLHLPNRAGKAIKPTYKMIDLRNQHLKDGLSKTLLTAIAEHLDRNNQVLIFLNRRGYASTLLCHACGWVAECPHCDAHLTFHAREQKLLCHHCGTTRPIYPHCLSCKQTELIPLGLGTEKLEDGLKKQFPNHPLIRLDRDTTKSKNAIHKLLAKIQSGHGQIILGTQMLAKGHHFPNVTLVAIVDADSGLFSTDFRATERLGQLIIQVSGRAGRAEKPGEVYIQTHHPDNPMLTILMQKGYSAFATQLLEEREQANLPPYAYFAMLRAEAKTAFLPNQFLREARKVPLLEPLDLLGPVPALMQRKAGQYRAQLLIQTNNRTVLQNGLPRLLDHIAQLPSARKVRWSLDVDPQEV